MKDWRGQWWPDRYSWWDRVRFSAEHGSEVTRLALNVAVSVGVCVGVVLLGAAWVHILDWLWNDTPSLATIPIAFGVLCGVCYWLDTRRD